MNHEQEQRYSRQISLEEIGYEGQRKLLESKVLVVGAGGLGAPALLYLNAMGVGTIGIAEGDRVEISNLGRQIIYETEDINRLKSKSSYDILKDRNQDSDINIYNFISDDNAEKIIKQYDLVIDCSDNFKTRYLLNDVCHNKRKALISSAIQRFEGQISCFTSYKGGAHPCYRCWYPEPPKGAIDQGCKDSGVLGAVAGIMGSWQAAEAIKVLLNIGDSLSGKIIKIDALFGSIKTIKLHKDPSCRCNKKAI